MAVPNLLDPEELRKRRTLGTLQPYSKADQATLSNTEPTARDIRKAETLEKEISEMTVEQVSPTKWTVVNHGRFHTVELIDGKYECSVRYPNHKGRCKHVQAVERYIQKRLK